MGDDYKNEEDLREALKRMYRNRETPDSTPSWLKVQAVIQKRKRRNQRVRRVKLSGAIIVGSIFVSLLANGAAPKAYSQFSSLFKRMKGEAVQFFFEKPDQDSSKAKTSPPDDSASQKESRVSQMKEITLDEAIENTAFPLLIPNELPKGYQLHIVRSFGFPDEPFYNVQQEYVNADGEIIQIIERIVEGGSADLMTEMDQTAGEYKELTINGRSAVLLLPLEGNVNLEWLTKDRVLVHLSGNMSEEEIIALAKSLK